MTKREEMMAAAEERTDTYVIEVSPDEDFGPEDHGVAVTASVSDAEGRSLIVEMGTGADGVFASVSAFVNDDLAEARVFSMPDSTMILVDGP